MVAWVENKRIGVTHYDACELRRLGDRTVRIVQVSDLHAKQFGAGGAVLLQRIRALEPDLIAVSGDLLDHRRSVAEVSTALVRDLHEVAPVYLVTGNHEFMSREWPHFRDAVELAGATVLQKRAVAVELSGGRSLTMAGIDDYLYFGKSIAAYRAALAEVAREAAELPRPVVLLAHRPEHFAAYVELGFDLVLSGHAHGGQVRIPGIGPLFAPDEGILPKHAQGMHRINGSFLIVSRGLGPSRIPLRIFNRPELVAVDIAV